MGNWLKALAMSGVGASLLWSVQAWAVQTNTQLITNFLYSGDWDFAFFVGQGPWVATGCSATYAQISNTQPGKDKLLAVVMMAYASGKRVTFQGTCNVNPTYFDITYVTVTD
jgi:hypothetical protein